MHLIVLRHAEREFGGDSPLTAYGRAQAEALAQRLSAGPWPRPMRLVCSPKVRARQTVAPLGNRLGLQAEIQSDLDERAGDESTADFRARLRRFLEAAEAAPVECAVWCTHLDWIEEFRALVECGTDLLLPPYDSWSPSQFLVLRRTDLWDVVEFARA